MSKSLGTVVPPDELISRYGADTERLYTLFIGPPDRDAEWNDTAVEGAHRFLNRVWNLAQDWPFDASAPEAVCTELACDALPEHVTALHRKTHQTIRKVTADFEDFHFNTAVAAIMELVNTTRSFIDSASGSAGLNDGRAQGEAAPTRGEPTRQERAAISEAVQSVVLLLSPMVPHLAEEIWERMGGTGSIFGESWPTFDELAAAEDVVTIAVQINGKLRGEVEVERGAGEDAVVELARAEERVRSHIEGMTVRRVIFVPDRLVNLVVG
jgi:leucyl-tRNA synthetase